MRRVLILLLLFKTILCTKSEPAEKLEDDFDNLEELKIQTGPYKATTGKDSRMPRFYYPSGTAYLQEHKEEPNLADFEDYDSCDSDFEDEFDLADDADEAPYPLITWKKDSPSQLFAALLQALLVLQFPPLRRFICAEEEFAKFKVQVISDFVLKGYVGEHLGELLDEVRLVCIQYEYSYMHSFLGKDEDDASEEADDYKTADKEDKADVKAEIEQSPEPQDNEIEKQCKALEVLLEEGQLSSDINFDISSSLGKAFDNFSESQKSSPADAATFFALLLHDPNHMTFQQVCDGKLGSTTAITLSIKKQLDIAPMLDQLLNGTFKTSSEAAVKLTHFPKFQIFNIARTTRLFTRQRANGTARSNVQSHRPVDIPLQLKQPYNSILRAAICFDTRPDERVSPHYPSRYSVIMHNVDEKGNYFSWYDSAMKQGCLIEEDEAVKRIARMGVLLLYQRTDKTQIMDYRYSACRPALKYPKVITRMPTKEELEVKHMSWSDVYGENMYYQSSTNMYSLSSNFGDRSGNDSSETLDTDSHDSDDNSSRSRSGSQSGTPPGSSYSPPVHRSPRDAPQVEYRSQFGFPTSHSFYPSPPTSQSFFPSPPTSRRSNNFPLLSTSTTTTQNLSKVTTQLSSNGVAIKLQGHPDDAYTSMFRSFGDLAASDAWSEDQKEKSVKVNVKKGERGSNKKEKGPDSGKHRKS